MISKRIQSLHYKIVSATSPNLLILLLRGLLYLLSIPYLFISKTRAFCYRSKIFKIHRIEKPVLSVGNISAGGTGKTPLCLELIQISLELKLIPALVSRGYGKDEQIIYQKKFPNLPMSFSANRIKACNELIQKHPELSLFILDDAFQHQKIHRDINILIVNASQPFGYNYCLPRGFLRESLTAMNRATLVILSHADEIVHSEKEKLKNKILSLIDKNVPIIEAFHDPDYLVTPTGKSIDFQQFKALGLKKTGILCGIAHPDAFITTLKKCQITPSSMFVYPDHHPYSSDDFKKLGEENQTFDCLITTEKDIVKIPLDTIKDLNIFTLVMKIKLSDSNKIINLIKEYTK